MNANTRCVYALARIYGYLIDIEKIVSENGNNDDNILCSITAKYAVNMCIHQIGEQAKIIRDCDKELYDNRKLVLHQIKGVRDKIAHTYDNIDYSVIRYILESYTPFMKACLEKLIDEEVLENPYVLYEREAQAIDISKIDAVYEEAGCSEEHKTKDLDNQDQETENHPDIDDDIEP